MLERDTHVRRRPRRGDADDEVAGAHAARVEVLTRRLESILGSFLRARQRGGSTGDDPLHHLGIGAEGGRAFRCVEHTEPARRSRADIEQPAAAAKHGLGRRDRRGDLFALRGDGGGHPLVLVVHEVHDAQRIRQVDLLRARVALLGDARIDDSGGHGVGREKLGAACPGICYRPPGAWANLPAAVRHWQAIRS
jgi:hypothetical protein